MDTGLACLVTVARLYGLPADPQQLRHSHSESGKTFDERTIILAGKELGLKIRALNSHWKRLHKTPLPAIAQHRDGRWFIIAGFKDDRVLIQDPLESKPLALPGEILGKSWEGRLILATRRARVDDPDGRFDFGWFIPAILKYRRLLGEVLLASLFVQLFALVTPLFFQVVVDKVLVHKGLTTLHVLAIGLLGISLFEVVLGGLRSYLFSHTTNRVDVALGAKLFRHLLALPIVYFEARRVGDSVARVRELENIRNFLTGSALTLVVDLVFTFVFFAVMYYYSPRLTLVVLGAIPFYLLLSVWITPIMRKRLNEKFNRGAENQAFLVESITGVETLKSMAVEPQMQRRWEEQLAGYVGASFRSANLGNIAGQTAGFINKVSVVLILWIGATLVMQGQLSVGQLIAFNMLAARISGPILRLVQLWQEFQQAGISVRRLGDILNTPTEPGYNPGRAALPALRGEVCFNGVSFRYRPDRAEVLRNIDLKIEVGEVIGIVGRSGSGKSTLTKLIQRLHVPGSGRVLIDGIDLALVEPAWLRRQVGVVLQENFLFNRTIRDNIALANPGSAMEQIVRASQLAGAHEFILELAEGYDTLVGERGATLSGGQRQRIALARTLLTNPRILILDEATSALDYESERIIQHNMRSICRERTVFIIAHRLSAVREADRIVVLDRGRIVEMGAHAELLAGQGQYAHLHAMQREA
ncbi:MAG: type I secretion system permease/ATPase [Chromatiaceae bacterium]|nr:type I secretion system permease/ATPase [Chromatiaceae bacterium]MCP5409451.1 type I secretion system permease/ATPase [Chromatiaceae bacterium]MCP5444313.1 type I secretion system permease/ATPase [Chromatiaceae bacterium]